LQTGFSEQDSTQTILSAGHKHTSIGLPYDQSLISIVMECLMAERKQSADTEPGKTSLYRIVVSGELHESWSDWLGKVDLERRNKNFDSCHTILLSEVSDQAALRGILNRLWDLNLELISLNKYKQGATDDN
jgi:hypothetical protein